MKDHSKLVILKILHTLIWSIFVAAIFYILIAGILNRIDWLLYLCIGAIFFEGFVLVFFGWKCPFTVLAEKYSDSRAANFDIYLPRWLAANNKLIFTSLFFVGLIVVVFRIVEMQLWFDS